MRAVIVANGAFQFSERLRELWDHADLRIAADGGARNARLFLEHAPQIIVGDMDSLDDETRRWLERNHVEFVQHPPAKDQTDLELAVTLAQTRGARESTILGALGGRIDHFLANVLLLARVENVRLQDAATEMWIGRGTDDIEGAKGDIVSLIPLDQEVRGIMTTGLEYPLRGETLERGSTRGISNVMSGERAHVSWTRGTLLFVHLFGQTDSTRTDIASHKS